MSASPSDYTDRLPPGIVRIARAECGIELYFPPFRAPAAALGLAAFGVLCAAIPAIAALALVPQIGAGPHGMIAAVLVGGFAAPFFLFGLVFVALAVHQFVNALYVRVEPSGIATARRAFGLTYSRRLVGSAEIAAIEPQIASRFQNAFGGQTSYRLMARVRSPGAMPVVIAENLPGAECMEHVRMLIEETTGVARQEETR
jgi:hypothetical protein